MKPKTELMKRLRDERKAKGLVELRVWLTPEQLSSVKKHIASLPKD